MYDELIKKAIEELENNDDLFIEMIEELDSWNGYADGFRAYEMCEINDICSGMSIGDFLDTMTGDFNKNDDYFYYSIWGLESTDSKIDLYRENVDSGELLDNIRDNFSKLDFWRCDDFKDLIEEIETAQDEENENE